MSDLVKREFEVLTPHGSNYLSWALDAEILLSGKGLLKTVKPAATDPAPTEVEKAQALHFLRHHLSVTLKNEYMTERDPKALWDSLHTRFEKIETVLLPKVEREWHNLRFQDHKTVEAYNTALYGIAARMELCGKPLEDKDLIYKTLSTFHPKYTHVSRQYKKDNYPTYAALSHAMQQDQGEDDLIMQNHLSRPTGSMAPHEANATSVKKNRHKGKGDPKAVPKAPPKPPVNAQQNPKQFKKNKKGKGKGKGKGKETAGDEYGKQDQDCFRCGSHGHWSKNCRTSQHLVNLYQEYKKKNGHEAHFVEGNEPTTNNAFEDTMKVDSGTASDDLELDEDLEGDFQ